MSKIKFPLPPQLSVKRALKRLVISIRAITSLLPADGCFLQKPMI
jgi:hypothetical protein